MSALDFTGLSDDQLLALIKGALVEVASRHPGLAAAVEAAMLDEAEKSRIAREAAEREAACIRARERERVAREAAEAVRRQHAQQAGASGETEARLAREKEERRQKISKAWLQQAADLVGRPAPDISIWLVDTRYGRRVLINPGSDRYETYHFADFNVANQTIRTKRELVRNKADLVEFCAKFAHGQTGTVSVCGDNYDWSQT